MVKQENILEKYKFLRLYCSDFNDALHTLKVLRRYRKKDVRYALIRDVVVTYCRPFTESKGFGIRKDLLGLKTVRSEMRGLHNELLTLRKEIFAHTDLTYRNPKVAKWAPGFYPMSFKGFDYAALERKLPKIEKMIEHAQKQVRDEISKYEKDL